MIDFSPDLHLFGAWDMYKREFDKGNAREKKCVWYFSDSIMRNGHYILGRKVDEMNAWLVGWKAARTRIAPYSCAILR